jgi:hypothetical protein
MRTTNARQPFAVVVVKRRGKGTGQAYVAMSLETFCRLEAVAK